jgi:hypothetical protein
MERGLNGLMGMIVLKNNLEYYFKVFLIHFFKFYFVLVLIYKFYFSLYYIK